MVPRPFAMRSQPGHCFLWKFSAGRRQASHIHRFSPSATRQEDVIRLRFRHGKLCGTMVRRAFGRTCGQAPTYRFHAFRTGHSARSCLSPSKQAAMLLAPARLHLARDLGEYRPRQLTRGCVREALRFQAKTPVHIYIYRFK